MVDGHEYPTRVEACLAYDVSYKSVNQLVARGMTPEEAIHWLIDHNQELGTVEPEPEDKTVVVRGVEYLHLIEVASAFNIPYLTYALLCGKYDDAEKALDAYFERLAEQKATALQRRKDGIETHLYRGVEYGSRAEVAEVLGISLVTLDKLVGGRTYDEVGDMMGMMKTIMGKGKKE